MYEAGHPKPVLRDNLEGWGGEGGGGGDTWIHRPIQIDVWLKPSQYCNYPPIKINKLI